MASKQERDRQKQIQEKCQTLLSDMLRDEDNKYCVDCDAKGPRWASWNLGIFLCIRCAGIHRNLGVHISKVKSVNLDAWTPEQVVSLQQMGNSRARAVYEANLPDNFRRPQTDSSLEAFVRAKYEQKKYIAREWVPPPTPKVNWDKELDEEAERQRRKRREAKQQQPRRSNTEVPVPQLLPKPKSSSSPKPGRTANDPNRKSATQDLLGLDTPVTKQGSTNSTSTSNGEDIFTSFLSAPTTAISTTVSSSPPTTIGCETRSEGDTLKNQGRTAEEESFFNQPAPSSQEKRQLTKDSILALYSTGPTTAPTGPTPVYGVQGGVYIQPSSGFAQVPPALGYGLPPSAAMSNGMMATQSLPSAVIQNGGYSVGSNQQTSVVANPFFNMSNTFVAPPQRFPTMTQEHASSSEQDLMLDFGSATHSSVTNQLPQQMSRLNLGGPVISGQSQTMLGVAPQGVPLGMQIGAIHQPIPSGLPSGVPSALPSNSGALGIGTFPQQTNQGHTLATNLWQ